VTPPRPLDAAIEGVHPRSRGGLVRYGEKLMWPSSS
jgi:hypothetical protein